MIYFKSQTVENKPKYKTNKQTKIQNKQTNKNNYTQINERYIKNIQKNRQNNHHSPQSLIHTIKYFQFY
jgi:ribosome-binding protein aMBF1 (putative translation factor)